MNCKGCKCEYCQSLINSVDKIDEQYKIIQIALESGNFSECSRHTAYSRTIIMEWSGATKYSNENHKFDESFSKQFLCAMDYYKRNNAKKKIYSQYFGFITIFELNKKKNSLIDNMFNHFDISATLTKPVFDKYIRSGK